VAVERVTLALQERITESGVGVWGDYLMRLEIAGMELPERYSAAMEAGISAMGIADPQVIATSTFDETVREIIGSSTYSSDRGAGVVAAKTVATDSGPVIIFNTPEVTREHAPADVERLMAHECGHAVLIDEGEVTEGHRGIVDGQYEWKLLCVGGLAIEEYRIERRLYELGYPVTESTSIDHLNEALHVNNLDIVAAVLDPESADPEIFEASVLTVVDRFAKLLAYMAAPAIVLDMPFRRDSLSSEARTHWDDYVGKSWDKRVALYRQIPDAGVRLSRSEWADLLIGGLQIESDFLERVGFFYTPDTGAGEGFYRVQDDAMFHRRVRRDVAARE
jgi:hypothetical protein